MKKEMESGNFKSEIHLSNEEMGKMINNLNKSGYVSRSLSNKLTNLTSYDQIKRTKTVTYV